MLFHFKPFAAVLALATAASCPGWKASGWLSPPQKFRVIDSYWLSHEPNRFARGGSGTPEDGNMIDGFPVRTMAANHQGGVIRAALSLRVSMFHGHSDLQQKASTDIGPAAGSLKTPPSRERGSHNSDGRPHRCPAEEFTAPPRIPAYHRWLYHPTEVFGILRNSSPFHWRFYKFYWSHSWEYHKRFQHSA